MQANLDWVKGASIITVEAHDWFIPGCLEAIYYGIGQSSAKFKESVIGEYRVFVQVPCRHGQCGQAVQPSMLVQHHA